MVKKSNNKGWILSALIGVIGILVFLTAPVFFEEEAINLTDPPKEPSTDNKSVIKQDVIKVLRVGLEGQMQFDKKSINAKNLVPTLTEFKSRHDEPIVILSVNSNLSLSELRKFTGTLDDLGIEYRIEIFMPEPNNK